MSAATARTNDEFAAVFGSQRRTGSGLPDRPSDELLYRELTEHGERWYLSKGGPLHRESGPALSEAHEDDGSSLDVWYRHGVIHREDGPAWVSVDSTGLVYEEWHRHGVMHRDVGPAKIITHPDNGEFYREEWCREGKLHRDGGPAVSETQNGAQRLTAYYQNGALHRDGDFASLEHDDVTSRWVKVWCQHGKWHRDEGPAAEITYDDGGLRFEWWQDGRLHREGQPARIDCAGDGYPIDIEMWSEGKKLEVPDDEWGALWAQAQKRSPSHEHLTQLQSTHGTSARAQAGRLGGLLRRLRH